MNIEIKQITTRKELKRFVQFALDLYNNNPFYCPPIIHDELNTLSEKVNPAFEICEAAYFMAYKGQTAVGRIAGIINHAGNALWKKPCLRFGWFDFVDDKEVSKALLDAVIAWGKEKGMQEAFGPVGFTDFDHQGLLIEGFQYLSPIASLYNYPYYEKHYQAYGLQGQKDWIEIHSGLVHQIPADLSQMCTYAEEHFKVKVVKVKSKEELIKRYGYSFFDVFDAASSPFNNSFPLTRGQKNYYADMFIRFLNFDFVTFVVNEKDEIVQVCVCMPNITKALQKAKGKLFPLGWWHILRTMRAKQFEQIDFLLYATRPDYQKKGINALLFKDLIPIFKKYGVKYSESGPILEGSAIGTAQLEYFNSKRHKRRRTYRIEL